MCVHGRFLLKSLIQLSIVREEKREKIEYEQHGPCVWRLCLLFEARKVENQPEILEWFEYLYNEMKKREQKPKKSKV